MRPASRSRLSASAEAMRSKVVALAGRAVALGRLGVPGLRDGQREDQRGGRGDQLRGRRVVARRRVDVSRDRPDDLRGGLAVALLDQGVEAVLAAEGIGHDGVAREQSEPDDAPAAALGRELVRIHGEVRPVKATDSHMDDRRLEARAVIGGHGDPAEGDRRRAGPG